MAAHQAPPSLGFSRQEDWSVLPFPSMHESEKWKWSHSVMSDSSQPHGWQPTRLLCPWDFPGKNIGVGCHRLLYAIAFSILCTRKTKKFMWFTLLQWSIKNLQYFQGMPVQFSGKEIVTDSIKFTYSHLVQAAIARLTGICVKTKDDNQELKPG